MSWAPEHCALPCLSVVRHTSSTKHCALPRLSLSLWSGTLPAPSTVPCPVCLSFGGQAHFQHQALCPAPSLSFSSQAHFQHQALCPTPSLSLSLSAVRHTSSTKHCALPSLSLFRWSGTLPAPTASYFLSPGYLSS